jgi:Mg-chelatase subunit ChlD
VGRAGPGRARARRAKKKDPLTGTESPRPSDAFRSIFSKSRDTTDDEPQPYSPLEAFGATLDIDPDESPEDLASASAWDVAIRYHELKARKSMRDVARALRRISAEAILDRAREVLGSVVHPVSQNVVPWSELPGNAEQPDFDFDETLENSIATLVSGAPLTEQDIWMSYLVHRKQPVVLAVDTSLSMTGEKLALTAVALAVVLLQFPDDKVGIVAFENEAQILKRPDERIGLQELVERFMDVPAQGYTHLEEGLLGALKLVRAVESGGQSRPPSTVLLTDGKYTAGRDPSYLAPRFPHLVVLKMGHERASMDLCRDLARGGSGALREVGDLESLPSVMYGVVKDLLRGRSLN